MGQAAIPIALAVAAAGTSAYNTAKTAKKQDRALAEGIRKQGDIQREANKRLNESLMFFEKSSAEPIQAELSDKFRNRLRLQQALALSGLEGSGDLSDAAVMAAAKARGIATDYGDFLEGVFSRIDAPGEQRRREGEERTDLGKDLSIHERNSRAEDYLARLQASSIRRNPWLDILAAGLSGASGGLAAGGGGAMAGLASAGAGATNVPGSALPPSAFYSASSAAQPLPGMTPAGLYGL